jgi:hypothetical protein
MRGRTERGEALLDATSSVSDVGVTVGTATVPAGRAAIPSSSSTISSPPKASAPFLPKMDIWSRRRGVQHLIRVPMLEFKQDSRTGRPFLMEVNGRFWGSLQLALDAGVDFPYFVFQLAIGQYTRGLWAASARRIASRKAICRTPSIRARR